MFPLRLQFECVGLKNESAAFGFFFGEEKKKNHRSMHWPLSFLWFLMFQWPLLFLFFSRPKRSPKWSKSQWMKGRRSMARSRSHPGDKLMTWRPTCRMDRRHLGHWKLAAIIYSVRNPSVRQLFLSPGLEGIESGRGRRNGRISGILLAARNRACPSVGVQNDAESMRRILFLFFFVSELCVGVGKQKTKQTKKCLKGMTNDDKLFY